MLPGVKGRLRLVAAALLLTVRLAGAHTSEAPTPGMPQTPHGTSTCEAMPESRKNCCARQAYAISTSPLLPHVQVHDSDPSII